MIKVSCGTAQKKQAKIRISLYGRQNIIQTGKDVVRVLGVPPYISIRINPEMDSILVEPAEEKHKLSFKVADDICFNTRVLWPSGSKG